MGAVFAIGTLVHTRVSARMKAMKCFDLQSNLALHADGFADEAESNSVKAHLDVCPLCRQRYFEFREIRTGLQQMRRPEISLALKNSIKRNVRAETQNSKTFWIPFSPAIRELLVMRVMPYGVGVCASFLVAVTFLTMMFSGMFKPETASMSVRGDTSIMLASNRSPFSEVDTAEISPSDYALTRVEFASESPSINPKGALIPLTKSLVRNGMKNDEVVVVADIFSNGRAQIAEVVEPSRNRRAVGELEKALDSDSAYAAFVPTTMENRPEYVRVVLKFQSVDVKTDLKRRKL